MKSGMGSNHHEEDIEIRFGIITVSTSRFTRYSEIRGIDGLNKIDDASGRLLFEGLSEFEVVDYSLVPDDIIKIREAVLDMADDVDAIVITGGTGITPHDLTVEAVEPLIDKKIDGFGELFRHLSFKEVGSAAILSRTFAGVFNKRIVFCLPGSRKAVKLGLRLIKESIKHLVTHAKGLK
jgi:molybdenum cofactor biosynthesis protein B